jgi:hypothetical protein
MTLPNRDLKFAACLAFGALTLLVPEPKCVRLRPVASALGSNIFRLKLMMLGPAFVSELCSRLGRAAALAEFEITGIIQQYDAPHPRAEEIYELSKKIFREQIVALREKQKTPEDWKRYVDGSLAAAAGPVLMLTTRATPSSQAFIASLSS